MIFILNNTNELRVWNFEDSRVRTLEIEGKPYFVGKDVAEVLGYAKPRNAIAKHIDDEDKKDAPIQGDLGGIQQMTLINESGLYSLILSSKMPNAKKFKRWVTSEVLPSIRRTGLYATDELIANPDLAIKAFTALKEERERNKTLARTIAVQNQQIAELKPKASYYDIILNCKDLVPITVIAKDYGKSAIWLNEFLHKLKYSSSRASQVRVFGFYIRSMLKMDIQALKQVIILTVMVKNILKRILIGLKRVDCLFMKRLKKRAFIL